MEEFKIPDKSTVMEDWRKYLGINGYSDSEAILFQIIEKAIMVAKTHYPIEFQIQREIIAKTLSSLNSSHSHPPSHSEQEININGSKQSMKKMSYDSSLLNNNHHSDTINSLEETEMLTVTDEVLRIKQILDTYESESESESMVIYDLLSKLDDMGLSYKNLEATKIGRSVTRFRNQGSRDVRLMATRLIKMWKAVANEWFKKQQEEEEKKEKQKEESIIKGAVAEKKQTETETETGMMKKELSTNSSRRNVIKIKIINRNSDKKVANMEQKSTTKNIEKMEEKSSTTVNNDIEKKLEATKRKLHQRYEEVENAKRQRKIQVVELHQLKSQGFISSPKTKIQNRKSVKMW